MSRELALCLLTAALVTPGCKYDPPGQCSDDTQCQHGRTCTNGVCVGCSSDAMCSEWQACGADHACRTREGRCDAAAGCTAWEECDADHVCVVAAGRCFTSDDCEEWEDCTTDHRCRLAADRCNDESDCLSLFPACDASHTCASSGPAGGRDVALWGTLSEGACYRDGLARLDAPTRVLTGFDCYTDSLRILSSGAVVYELHDRLHRFGPDRWTLDDSGRYWSYPFSLDNDPFVPTPGCSNGVARFLPVAGGDRVVYSCRGETGELFYDSDGSLVSSGVGLLAWTASQTKLGVADRSYVVLDAANQQVVVTGIPPSFVRPATGRPCGCTGPGSLSAQGPTDSGRSAPTAWR